MQVGLQEPHHEKKKFVIVPQQFKTLIHLVLFLIRKNRQIDWPLCDSSFAHEVALDLIYCYFGQRLHWEDKIKTDVRSPVTEYTVT